MSLNMLPNDNIVLISKENFKIIILINHYLVSGKTCFVVRAEQNLK